MNCLSTVSLKKTVLHHNISLMFKTIEWVNNKIRLIDQTLLPLKYKQIYCREVSEIYEAIQKLQVRGAPAIGIAGALGVLLGVQKIKTKDVKIFQKEAAKIIKYLASARLTAVNLFWALDIMNKIIAQNRGKNVTEIKKQLKAQALAILEEDKHICRLIGQNGAPLIKNGIGILTHCNAGGLATADYGTALAVMFKAKEQGKKFQVFAGETRPLLQGARLTTWELMKHKIPVTLICDNMAAQVMKEGKIGLVITGADRIAANGDSANKIGTYGLAVLAKEHGIPFYIAAPFSTFDLSLKNGGQIPIEQRDPEEVTAGFGRRTAPLKVKVYNPAFDVTPAKYITGIITERGIIENPTAAKIKKAFRK